MRFPRLRQIENRIYQRSRTQKHFASLHSLLIVRLLPSQQAQGNVKNAWHRQEKKALCFSSRRRQENEKKKTRDV